MLEKLDIVKQRFDEVSDLIIQPDIISDQKKYVQLNKEYKDLREIMDKREQYLRLNDRITEAEEILADGSDPEMTEMAKMQLDEARGTSSDSDDDAQQEVPTGVDFTVDLSGPDGVALENNGDFIIRNEVVVARNLQGQFVAASRICSHEQNAGVSFVEIQGGIFECEVHGSRFDQNGAPLNTITQNPLKIFNTDLQGDLLRVFE